MSDSRERFEALAYEQGIAHDRDQKQLARIFWQAAVRDTREQCAEIVRHEYENWDYRDLDRVDALRLFAENLVDRIRQEGK